MYFANLNGQGIKHSGDDLTGDIDDDLDKEIITVDLIQVYDKVTIIAFILNSYLGRDFKNIPFASIRLYEGTPKRVDNFFASFDIANDSKFSGSVAMIMGKILRIMAIRNLAQLVIQRLKKNCRNCRNCRNCTKNYLYILTGEKYDNFIKQRW